MDEQNYQLLKISYDKLKNDMVKNNHYEIMSNTLFKEIGDKMLGSSKLNNSVEYLNDIFISDRADSVSSVGTGRMNKRNFKEFLDDNSTRVNLGQLIGLAKQKSLSISNIKDIGLLEHLDRFPFDSGNKPLAYTHRIFILLFPENKLSND